jgi:hypothetical protein
MGTIFRPGDVPETGAPRPAGLALGDAWFWHGEQTLLQALADHPRVDPRHAVIRLLGFNGARLNDYIGNGVYADVIRTHLARGMAFSEFYLSGFAADAMEHGLALRDDCSNVDEPARCIAPERLDLLLYHVDAGLSGIIRTIRWAGRNGTRMPPIFLNGYDYPVPDGRGFVHPHGGWITTVMDAAGVDPSPVFRTGVMRCLVDALNDEVLAGFHAPLQRVFHVDSRGTLATDAAAYADDWEVEMYPTREGFGKLLERAWFRWLAPFGIVTGT